MKILFSAISVLLFGSHMWAGVPPDQLLGPRALAEYQARDYTPAGFDNAVAAVRDSAQLAQTASDTSEKIQALVLQSKALFFVGGAQTDVAEAKKSYLAGEAAADQACHLLGVADVTKVSPEQIAKLKDLPAAELALLGQSLYLRAAHLGKWGALASVKFVGKWPELRKNLQLIQNLDLSATNNFGADLILGYSYYNIPSLFGGDTQKAEKYLEAAVQGSLAAGQIYSVSGANNLAYAQILIGNHQAEAAQKLLMAFVQADPNILDPELIPENRKAIQDARAMLPK